MSASGCCDAYTLFYTRLSRHVEQRRMLDNVATIRGGNCDDAKKIPPSDTTSAHFAQTHLPCASAALDLPFTLATAYSRVLPLRKRGLGGCCLRRRVVAHLDLSFAGALAQARALRHLARAHTTFIHMPVHQDHHDDEIRNINRRAMLCRPCIIFLRQRCMLANTHLHTTRSLALTSSLGSRPAAISTASVVTISPDDRIERPATLMLKAIGNASRRAKA
eukprot:3670565-Pleurochrysis_carterae.AAC.5